MVVNTKIRVKNKEIIMINTQRLGDCFKMLAQIDSESYHEAKISKVLEKILLELGASVCFDDAAQKVGGNCSNLVAKFKGTKDVPALFLSGHMDTVLPGKGVKVQFKNGIFTRSEERRVGKEC